MKKAKFGEFGEPIKQVDEDALMGYILKIAHSQNINITYEEAKVVLDAELEFLTKRGIANK